MKLKTLFVGTAPYGCKVMNRLEERVDVDFKGVVTKPSKRRGRGQKKQLTPVGKAAEELDLPIYQPASFNEEADEIFSKTGPLDLMFVVAFGQILKPEVFHYPQHGSYNFHASLLPRWRGAAPIRHTLLAGDEKTGVTIFKLVEDLDAGPICVQKEIQVKEKESYKSLYNRLSELNCKALDTFLERLKSDALKCKEQSGSSTYASRISKADAEIDWQSEAEEIERQIRAYYPRPGAHTKIGGERCIICRASVTEGEGEAGEIVAIEEGGLVVAAGRDALRIEALKPAGSREMKCEAFQAGRQHLEVGNQVWEEENR